MEASELKCFYYLCAKGTLESLDASVCLGLPHSSQPGNVGKKNSRTYVKVTIP